MFERRKRFKSTFATRERLQRTHGVWMRPGSGNQSEQRAAHLVIESGDMLLELLVTTLEDQHRDDGKALTAAIRESEAVARSWTFLTYAVAARTSSVVGDAGVEDVVRELLAPWFPLNDEDAEVIVNGPKAEPLGYWSLEWLYSHHALSLLLGQSADRLHFFEDFEAMTGRELLRVAWEHGSERFMDVIEEGVLKA